MAGFCCLDIQSINRASPADNRAKTETSNTSTHQHKSRLPYKNFNHLQIQNIIMSSNGTYGSSSYSSSRYGSYQSSGSGAYGSGSYAPGSYGSGSKPPSLSSGTSSSGGSSGGYGSYSGGHGGYGGSGTSTRSMNTDLFGVGAQFSGKSSTYS